MHLAFHFPFLPECGDAVVLGFRTELLLFVQIVCQIWNGKRVAKMVELRMVAEGQERKEFLE